MYVASEINLSSFSILKDAVCINNSYGPSYLVSNGEETFVSQYFYKSQIKDDADNGKSPFHCEIMAFNRLNNESNTIIKYYGFSNHGFEKGTSVILLEYINGKSLREIIRGNHDEWNETNKMKSILGIAFGMKYSHQRGVCHRELSPDCILYDSDFNPKICYFENAKIFDLEDSEGQLTTTIKGSFLYMDPNIYCSDEEGYDPKATDVFSFAHLLYIILSGRDDRSKLNLYTSINRLPSLSIIDEPYRSLIESCWNHDENTRPTFAQIVEKLVNEDYWLHGADHEIIRNYIKSLGYEDSKTLKEHDIKISIPSLESSVEQQNVENENPKPEDTQRDTKNEKKKVKKSRFKPKTRPV